MVIYHIEKVAQKATPIIASDLKQQHFLRRADLLSPANPHTPITIDELRKRHQRLNERKIAAETELKGAIKRLDELKKEARDTFDTDDILELQKKLKQMEAENESKRAAYQAELERIETDLASVESRFAAAEG